MKKDKCTTALVTVLAMKICQSNIYFDCQTKLNSRKAFFLSFLIARI